MNIQTLFFIMEIIGTVSFSISGAITAIQKKLDIFGIIVLSTVCAVGGGLTRDIILGVTPPVMFRKPVYVVIAVLSAFMLIIIREYTEKERIENKKDKLIFLLNVSDSVGLGMFVVIGLDSALSFNYINNPFLCVFVETLTGVGGSILRDIFVGEIPVILRKRIYAIAAILGSLIYYYMIYFKIYKYIAAVIAIVVVFTVRTLAIHYKWNLPDIKE